MIIMPVKAAIPQTSRNAEEPCVDNEFVNEVSFSFSSEANVN